MTVWLRDRSTGSHVFCSPSRHRHRPKHGGTLQTVAPSDYSGRRGWGAPACVRRLLNMDGNTRVVIPRDYRQGAGVSGTVSCPARCSATVSLPEHDELPDRIPPPESPVEIQALFIAGAFQTHHRTRRGCDGVRVFPRSIIHTGVHEPHRRLSFPQ